MLKDNIEAVHTRIKEALAQREEKKVTGEHVQLVAVTKNHPADVILASLENGIANIGENRVQEAQSKQNLLGAIGTWHLIGHLQTNKVKAAVEIFDIIESVDSEKVLSAINNAAAKINKVQDILLQLNIAGEKQKSGLTKTDYQELLLKLPQYMNIRLRGLMVIAQQCTNIEETRPVFRKGYEEFCWLEAQKGFEKIDILSMGMTHDYWVAIEEGANYIRVGTALFGQRDYSLNK